RAAVARARVGHDQDALHAATVGATPARRARRRGASRPVRPSLRAHATRGEDMYDVMQGVRVVEVAGHTFVPAAAMILADWGADVIKVERAAGGGDAGRTMRVIQRPGLRSNPFFEAANRNKR